MMVKKKKKQSRSQSSTEKKTLEPKPFSIVHSKLTNGNDSKHMLRGMSSKPAQGLSSQSKVVRCPKCHKFLQEPVDVTIYKCSGCNSILQAKHVELENNDNSVHSEDLLSSQTCSLTPVRSSYRKYSSRASPSVETAYRRHETSYIPREWIRRRAEEFSVTGDFASARSCSGVVKLSMTKKEDTTLFELLRFVDPGTSFAEEAVAIHHHDSSSDSPLSSSDKGSGDRICISTDAVNLQRFEDKGIKERDIEQQQQQQPASRIHLEQSEEESAEGGGGSKTPVRSSYRKYSSRASPLFERGHETSYIRREWIRSASPSPSSYGYTSPFHGSQVSSSERSYHHHQQPNQFKQYGREGWFQEFSSAGASPVRFQGETADQKCYHWSSQQSQMHDSQLSITKKQETLLDVFRSVDSSTIFAEETVVIHQDSSSDSHLSSSDNSSGDRVCISTDAVMWERFEDNGIKEDIRSISSKFIDLTFQPQWNHKLRAQASLGSGEILVSHSVDPLNKKEHVYETNVLSENTRDTQEFDLGELKWEDIMGKKRGLLLEKSRYTRDSICDSSSISSKFYDLKLEAFQPWLNQKEDTNQSLIGNPEQSGKATVREHMIHEEQSKHEYENISERPELLDKTISDIVSYGLEESEALEPGKVSEDGCVVSHKKTRETFKTSIEGETSEERFVFQHVESQNEKFDSYYGLETVYAGERRWAETVEDRAGLHLEEYETNYENYTNPFEEGAPTFHMHKYEPVEEAQGRLESSSRNSFSDHEISEDSAVIQESQDAKPDQSKYEIARERQELSNTAFDIVRSESEECRYTTIETFERRGYASERTWTETMGDGSGLRLEEYQSNPHEWTSERASTFPLHEHELGTMSEHEEDVSERSISSSKNIFDDHESSKERALAHEKEPWLVDENKIEELKVGVMVEETFGLTGSTPMFCLHEPELGTLLEPDNEADGSSESSSTGCSFSSHESSKLRAVFHQEEEPQVMSDSRTEMISVNLEEIFEWTTERAPTFRLYEPELGALLEPDEDAYGRSEREMDHGEDSRLVTDVDEPLLVDDYETKALKIDIVAEDGPSLNQTLEPREDVFRLSLDDTLEQERMTFHLEISQNKEVNLRQTFKQEDTEENIQAHGSVVFSEDQESPSITAEVDSDVEEEILRDHLEYFQKENENSGLTSKPYAHFSNTTEPSENVGLCHALYQTQTSPLRSPLSSPIQTPIGSPLHILMRSPMRSPTSLSGSLSDVLFGKKP